ncbi:MAG: hypothetical protein L0287_08270, partial [Anaerolineae bacterium]|nr:hypothetical protein [Anaerolineae bacterium]
MFSKISTKILVLFVVNVIVWVSLLGVIFYFVASHSLEDQINSTLKATASVLASQWDGSLLVSLQPGMEGAPLYRSFAEKLNLLKRKTLVEGIYIATMDRTCIVSSEAGFLIGQPLPRLDLLRDEVNQAQYGNVVTSNLIRVEDHDYKSAIAPIFARDHVVAVLMIDMSPQYLIYLKSFRNFLIAFTTIALLCCVVSARLFSRSITTPISRML